MCSTYELSRGAVREGMGPAGTGLESARGARSQLACCRLPWALAGPSPGETGPELPELVSGALEAF